MSELVLFKEIGERGRTIISADRKELARNYDLVDMEGYAVARECEAHDIPCILLKGVTDFGDSNAKKDIKENITPVSETVADALMYTLEGLKLLKKRK